MSTELDLAYAAGLFDGEGSISFAGKRLPAPMSSLAMTDKDTVEWMRNLFGIGSICTSNPLRSTKRKWVWQTRHLDTYALCSILLPYLKLKGPVAYLVICYYQEGHYEGRQGRVVPQSEAKRRQMLKNECILLNARGVYE